MQSSDAIDPNISRIVIVGESWCPFCSGACKYFDDLGMEYTWIDSGEVPKARYS